MPRTFERTEARRGRTPEADAKGACTLEHIIARPRPTAAQLGTRLRLLLWPAESGSGRGTAGSRVEKLSTEEVVLRPQQRLDALFPRLVTC